MPLTIKKENGRLVVLSGEELLPEGEAVRVITAAEFRRILGLHDTVSEKTKTVEVPDEEQT